MKKIALILFIAGLLFSCSTQVEFCESKHPHYDKVVVDLDWTQYVKSTPKPEQLSLYLWQTGGMLDNPSSATPEKQVVFDLPTPGDYQMMLLSDAKNFMFIDANEYGKVKVAIKEAVVGYSSLSIVPLGSQKVIDNNAILTSAKVLQATRKVTVQVSLNNAAFLFEEANVTLSGCAKQLELATNKAVVTSDKNYTKSLVLGASSMKVTFSMFAVDKSAKQILSLVVQPKNGQQQTVSVDVTKHIQEFEVNSPNKNTDLVILLDAQTYHSAEGTIFKINTVSLDGNIVDRGGDI